MSSQDKIHVLSRAAIIHDDKILLRKTLDLEISFNFLPGGHNNRNMPFNLNAFTDLFRQHALADRSS